MKKECKSCIEALGESSRVAIYEYLLNSTKFSTVNDVVKKFNLSQSTVSYHLEKLSKPGLLTNRKMGRNSLYKVCSKCPYDKDVCFFQK